MNSLYEKNINGNRIKNGTLYPQNLLAGGGTITIDSNTSLKWSAPFVIAPVDKVLAPSGKITIPMPAVSTADVLTKIPVISDNATQTYVDVTAAGIIIPSGNALYAIHTFIGGVETLQYIIFTQNATDKLPVNAILLAFKDSGSVVRVANSTVSNAVFSDSSLSDNVALETVENVFLENNTFNKDITVIGTSKLQGKVDTYGVYDAGTGTDFFSTDVNPKIGAGANNQTIALVRLRHRGDDTGFTGVLRPLLVSESKGGGAFAVQLYESGLRLGYTTLAAPTAMLDIKGAGSTSATSALLIKNSTDTEIFKIANDGGTYVNGQLTASNTATNSVMFTLNSPLAVHNISYSFSTNSAKSLILTGQSTSSKLVLQNVSGSGSTSFVMAPIAPTSGTAQFIAMDFRPEINATGTYSGIIRGLHYNPILTSIVGVKHRAIELASGDVFLGVTSGNVQIGTSSEVEAKLYVKGKAATNATTALRVDDSNGISNMSLTDDGTLTVKTGIKIGTNSVVTTNDVRLADERIPLINSVDISKMNPASMVLVGDIPESEIAKLLVTTNWNEDGDYIGDPIVNTFQGQSMSITGYRFVADEDNVWSRLIKG
jgi:hypothetical protein